MLVPQTLQQIYPYIRNHYTVEGYSYLIQADPHPAFSPELSSFSHKKWLLCAKLEKEDPEERKHREAQLLMYKALEQADKNTLVKISSTQASWLRLKIRTLKLKVGKKLKKMRKAIVLSMSNVCVYRSFMGSHLKTLCRLFLGGSSATSDKAPLHGILNTGS